MVGRYVHYQPEAGRWDDVDLDLRSVGADAVMDRHDLLVKVTGAGVEAAERATGAGIRWLTPRRPSVAGRLSRFADQGLEWTYSTRNTGVKLGAVVGAARGLRTYAFSYQPADRRAEALSVTDVGALVNDTFSIPRSVAIGADGTVYPAGPWRVVGDGRVAFDFDDAALPPASASPTSWTRPRCSP